MTQDQKAQCSLLPPQRHRCWYWTPGHQLGSTMAQIGAGCAADEGFAHGCPQPCQGLSLAAPCCKVTEDAPWDAHVGIGWDHRLGLVAVSVPAPSPRCLVSDGLSHARAACPALAAAPRAAGWHQMKTNGLVTHQHPLRDVPALSGAAAAPGPGIPSVGIPGHGTPLPA